jgi:hypothetical protein
MERSEPLDRLQKIADYRTAYRFLRTSGKHSMIFGAILLALILQDFGGQPGDALLATICAVEVLIGAWNRFNPSPVGMILDGCWIGLLGVVSIYRFAVMLPVVGRLAWISFAFGVSLLLAAAMRFAWYGRAKRAFADPPTEDQIAWLDELVKEILAADPATDPQAVAFSMGATFKGKLLGDTAVFVMGKDVDLFVAARDDVEFEVTGKLFGRKPQAMIRIGRRKFPGATLSEAAVANYRRWKDDAPIEPEVVDDPA